MTILNSTLEQTYAVVDEIFSVFESVKNMFRSWDSSKHMPFIQEVMKLQALEVQLNQLGYEDDFVRLIVKAVHESVFTKVELRQYSGNWMIIK